MKKVYWSILLACLVTTAMGQTLTSPAGTAVSQLPGNRVWNNVANATGNVNATTSTSGILNNGNPNTRVLALTNFNFAALPANITIDGITATVTRSSTGGTALDVIIELIKGGAIQTAANRANAIAWPAALTAVNYGGATDLWNNTWTRADIAAANFGIAISATRNGANTTAAIDAVTITVHYTVVTPIILTRFDVIKTGNGQASISFTTSSEEKVKWLIIERSPDGQHFSDFITLSPRGALNTEQHYQLTDPSPLPGISYYRLKEIDIDGKQYYYDTRVLNNMVAGKSLRAFENNGKILIKISHRPGNYSLSLFDLNGIMLMSQNININSQLFQLSINSPTKRSGIYLLHLNGPDGVNETTRVYISH
jgi:hypothetical protein